MNPTFRPGAAPDDVSLALAVREKFRTEHENLERLEATGRIRPVERQRAALIRALAAAVTRRRALSDKDRLLVSQFLAFGAKAVLSSGSQRGGDFLNNQLRGRWAENVVLSMTLPLLKVVAFGPSGAAMPGHEDHRRIITTFAEIELLEGKRPDLIAFDVTVWKRLSPSQRERALTWPERLLDATDIAIVRQARFGIEVKNSTWHFGRRREHHATLDEDEDGGRLSITVKDEELVKIVGWMRSAGKPVLFFQVLFDEIYCMSFSRMVDALAAGHVYTPGDYLLDGKTGAGGKLYHKFYLSDTRHRCAGVQFPNESVAHVEVLTSGSVIPYVELLPARAIDEQGTCIETEVRVAESAFRKGLPVIPDR